MSMIFCLTLVIEKEEILIISLHLQLVKRFKSDIFFLQFNHSYIFLPITESQATDQGNFLPHVTLQAILGLIFLKCNGYAGNRRKSGQSIRIDRGSRNI